jgi:ABC-type dipeptide/oligopeptide/nickel transport system permease component
LEWNVLAFLLKRLLFLIPILVGVSFVAFVVTRILPGDPARIYAGIYADEAAVQQIRAEYGFDQPLPVQYVRYLSGLARGDLGKSVRTRNPVLEDLIARAPATIELALAAITFALLVGVPLGIASAVWRGSLLDRIGRFLSTLGVSIPDFWLGLLLILLLYVQFHVVPAPVGRLGLLETPPNGPTGLFSVDSLLSGNIQTFFSSLGHLIMPTLALGFPAMGPLFRLTRNATIDVLRSDYILFARASGLRGPRLYLKYVLRNSIPGSVTLTGLIFGYLIGGTVLVEKVFAWPGLGFYASNSLDFNDYAAVQGFVLLSAVVYLLVFLALDLVLSVLDPRVRLQ